MKRKKKQNKPDRKRGIKSWLSIGAVALVTVITLGIVAALISPVAASSGPSGSGGGTSGSSTGSVSKPNVEDAPVVSYRLLNEVYFDDPDESYYVDADNRDNVFPHVNASGMSFGELYTTDEYLKFCAFEGDHPDASTSDFGIYLSGLTCSSGVEVPVSMSTMDYLVVDFDVWTDSQYFEEMSITFNYGENADYQFGISNFGDQGVFITNKMLIDYVEGNGNDPSMLPSEMTQQITDPSKPIHVTLFLMMNQESATYGDYLTSYTDGNFYSYYVATDANYVDITDLKIAFDRDTVNDSYSVCFDNFTFCAYGTGDGSYDGDMSILLDAFKNSDDGYNRDGMSIKNCRDWILYGKYE